MPIQAGVALRAAVVLAAQAPRSRLALDQRRVIGFIAGLLVIPVLGPQPVAARAYAAFRAVPAVQIGVGAELAVGALVREVQLGLAWAE